MLYFATDKDKTVNAALYILQTLGKTDFHTLFKILFFAEKEHLAKYGRPITGDSYIAMNYGPVPSYLYDLLKSKNEFFTTENKTAEAKLKTDLDSLSKTDINCLNDSIKENMLLTFNERTEKSHGSAYNQTKRNQVIDFEKIAVEGGANSEMLKYIEFVSDNQKPFVNA